MKIIFCFFILFSAFAIDFSYSVGAAGIFQNDIRVGQNIAQLNNPVNFRAFPALSFKLGNFSLSGPIISYRFWTNGPVAFTARIRPYGHEYRHEQIAHRRDSFFGGIAARIFFLNIQHFQDINSRSNGAITQLSLGKRFNFSDSYSLGLRLGYEFFDQNYVDYYFGVQPQEVGTFQFYRGDSTVHPFAGVANFIKFSKNWYLNVFLTMRDLREEVTDSPTVAQSFEYSGVFIVGYQFN